MHGPSTETGISIRIGNKSVIESNRSRKKRKFIKAGMERRKWAERETGRERENPFPCISQVQTYQMRFELKKNNTINDGGKNKCIFMIIRLR